MAPIGPPWGGAWFPDENTFLGSGCNITNTSSMKAATRLQVYFVYILSRSGRAVAHDEERRAFERLGIRLEDFAEELEFLSSKGGDESSKGEMRAQGGG